MHAPDPQLAPVTSLLTNGTASTPAATSRAYQEDRKALEALLRLKLRGIPADHVPSLTVEDIIHRTAKTRFANVPEDIGLEFLLRWRREMDALVQQGMIVKGETMEDQTTLIKTEKYGEHLNEQGTHTKIEGPTKKDLIRAVWFYRLSPTHQFQRYHDFTRWNIAIFTALLTQHKLHKLHKQHTPPTSPQTRPRPRPRPRQDTSPTTLSPPALRFIQTYLTATLEHHTALATSTSPPPFKAREQFITRWQTSPLDLFAIHKSWAKKALQRALKQLSSEWEREISRVRDAMESEEFETRVQPLVGCLVPGRCGLGRGGVGIWGGEEGEGEGLLEALRVPCADVMGGDGEGKGKGKGRVEDDGAVCDLRTAVSVVQSVRPRDMLPVLMRLVAGEGVEGRWD